jgi:hypothetical protein
MRSNVIVFFIGLAVLASGCRSHPCDDLRCGANSVACTVERGEAACECDVGYTGVTCETLVRHIELDCPAETWAHECTACTVDLTFDGMAMSAPDATEVTLLASTSAIAFFEDVDCGTATSTISIGAGGGGQAAFSFRALEAGNLEISTENDRGFVDGSGSIAVGSLAPTDLSVIPHRPPLGLALHDDGLAAVCNDQTISIPPAAADLGLGSALLTLNAELPTFESAPISPVAGGTFVPEAPPAPETLSDPVLLTTTASFPAAAEAACTFEAPYDGETCEIGVSTLDPAVLQPADLVVRAFAANGAPEDALASDPIPTGTLVLQQLLDFGGDALDDFVTILLGNDSHLFVYARPSDQGSKLYRYALATGTLGQVANFAGCANHDGLFTFGGVMFGDEVYFRGPVIGGHHKLVRLGSTRGIEAVVDLNDDGSDGPIPLLADGTRALYFTLVNSNGARKLYVYRPGRGTTGDDFERAFDDAGTPVDQPNDAGNLTLFDGCLYLTARNVEGFIKLFRVCGDTKQQLTDLRPGATDSIGNLTPFEGRLYFTGANADGNRKLYAFDPAASTVRRVVDLTGNDRTDATFGLHVHGGRLFFNARTGDSDATHALFSLDSAGVLRQHTDPEQVAWPQASIGADDHVLFWGRNDEGRFKLHAYSLVTEEVWQVADTQGDPSLDDGWTEDRLFAYQGRVYVRSGVPPDTDHLFVYDPRGGRLVEVADRPVHALHGEHGDRFYLSMENPSGSRKLYALCDTSAGCVP